MAAPTEPRTRRLRAIAQDPSVRYRGRILTFSFLIPAEELALGPRGYRLQVIDHDVSADRFYPPRAYDRDSDPYANADDDQLVGDPRFHAQNVYTIVMATLARFEFALGRRMAWAFGPQQLKLAPHAFAEPNAFYSRRDEAIVFGYFPSQRGETIHTSLSHDVIAHETTHAIVDGLRPRYLEASDADQAGFHEGFADAVALLSILQLPDVVRALLDRTQDERLVEKTSITTPMLKKTALFGLADQLGESGEELAAVRGNALRRSADLTPDKRIREREEFQEPHRRGEILVAPILNAMLGIWQRRISSLGAIEDGKIDRLKVAEEGAYVATTLLNMVIRALDFAPPVDLTYDEYLAAILTADAEVKPNDASFREGLREQFEEFGIASAAGRSGIWPVFDETVSYDRSHYESMLRDPNEVFRFVWENLRELELDPDAHTVLTSVRSSLRTGIDGFVLRETVADYVQLVDLPARELKRRGIDAPKGIAPGQHVRLWGGGALIFDEYGRLKFHIANRILDAERQTKRLEYLWRMGALREGTREGRLRRAADLHRHRAGAPAGPNAEAW